MHYQKQPNDWEEDWLLSMSYTESVLNCEGFISSKSCNVVLMLCQLKAGSHSLWQSPWSSIMNLDQLIYWFKLGVGQLCPKRVETYLNPAYSCPVSMDTITWGWLKGRSGSLALTLQTCKLGYFILHNGLTINSLALPHLCPVLTLLCT